MNIFNIRKAVSEWLYEYVRPTTDFAPEVMPDNMIRQALELLLKNGVFGSYDEIKKEVLKEKGVLVDLEAYLKQFEI